MAEALGRRRRRIAELAWLVLLTTVLGSLPLQAQGPGLLQPREAQFVFVVDDSGSMSLAKYGRNDPDRLAVFAVRALLGVLDDRDWASIVRLNGPRENEQSPPLAPLDPNHRQRLKKVLDLGGSLAAYRGQVTPCRSALEDARELLDGADRANTSQVLIFLSDGRCTPGDEEQVGGFLDGLRSNEASGGRFQFYLLRFQGTQPAPELERLAKLTGGATIELRRGDPTRILHAFAQALSRSQGYESQILNASNSLLPAHRGARRVRLLAVVPGEATEALEIRLADLQGNPIRVTTIDQAPHHYLPGGREYRFVSAEYRPTGEPARVQVFGAGDAWDLVALPEYRLRTTLDLHRGRCGASGRLLESNTLTAGTDLCAVIRLVNSRNQAVGQDVTQGKLRGVLEISSPQQGPPVEVSATPSDTRETRFELDLQALTEGYHALRAAVYLSPSDGGEPRTLPARPRTLQAVDRAIEATPGAVAFGQVFPGHESTVMMSLAGRFSESEAQLEVRRADKVPTCINLSFAGQPLGVPIRVLPNQKYPLVLRVAESCAEEEVAPFSSQLVVRIPELPAGGELTVPLTWRLDSTVHLGNVLNLRLNAGELKQGEVPAPVGLERGDYRARLEIVQPPGGKRSQSLLLGFRGGRREASTLLGEDGKPRLKMPAPFGPEDPIRLLAQARPCCGGGLYHSRLRLTPVDGGQAHAVPIEILVSDDWWACYRSWVLAGLLGLVVALVVYYVLSMFTHSSFLKREQLMTSLLPLRWPEYGGKPQPAARRRGDREVVEDMILMDFRWHHRALNWLQANPLAFGLPGKRYRETLELQLSQQLDGSTVELVPERDVVGRLTKVKNIEKWEQGRLFLLTEGGVAFYAVRGEEGTLGVLKPEGWSGRGDLKIERMKKGHRLIHRDANQEHQARGVAGWVLG